MIKKKDKAKATNEREDLVLTPAGPMPKDQVHAVGPDEVVRVDKSGKLVVAHREEKSSKNEEVENDR